MHCKTHKLNTLKKIEIKVTTCSEKFIDFYLFI